MKRLVVVGAVVCLGMSISVGQASPAALSSKSSDIVAQIAGHAMTSPEPLQN
jgi:hypothetical protein